MNRFTLLELNTMVRNTIETTLPEEFWMEAELSEAKEKNGHCYLDLIEKDERSNTPVAHASARCWRNTWMLLKPHFERATGQPLRAGMKVLLKVYAQFHENYGFSWIVTDIDPSYTMGDMARKRQEIIRLLKEQGVFDLQKQLRLPLFTQRIAVVSSESAAGYGDFCNQLADNPYGFQFATQLFPAIMQGEGVEQSIIAALNRIYDVATSDSPFDCVVIIRGGGATSDLSGFDTLALAENVANFPLPVITGIGHDRDESILDMVAHTRVKTPTAAAAFLVDHLLEVSNRVDSARDVVVTTVQHRMQLERLRLERLSRQIPTIFSLMRTRQEARLQTHYERLKTLIGQRLLSQRHRLQLLMQRADGADPERLLKRGYSITLKDGRAIRSAADLHPGDEITTKLEQGTVKSKVI